MSNTSGKVKVKLLLARLSEKSLELLVQYLSQELLERLQQAILQLSTEPGGEEDSRHIDLWYKEINVPGAEVGTSEENLCFCVTFEVPQIVEDATSSHTISLPSLTIEYATIGKDERALNLPEDFSSLVLCEIRPAIDLMVFEHRCDLRLKIIGYSYSEMSSILNAHLLVRYTSSGVVSVTLSATWMYYSSETGGSEKYSTKLLSQDALVKFFDELELDGDIRWEEGDILSSLYKNKALWM